MHEILAGSRRRTLLGARLGKVHNGRGLLMIMRVTEGREGCLAFCLGLREIGSASAIAE